MERFVIRGGNKLNGKINISGAKNAALAAQESAENAEESAAQALASAQAAQESAEYREYLAAAGQDGDLHYDIKMEAVQLLLDHVDDTFVTPVFNGSASLRDASGQLIEETVKAIRRKKPVDEEFMEKHGEIIAYAADEFYLLAEREIPKADFYGDFLQLENGVGLWALLKSEAESALTEIETLDINRKVSVVTGELAAPLLREIAGNVSAKFQNFTCF